MLNIIQALERLVDSHSQSFDKGERQNKQLKLLQVYLKGTYTGKNVISMNNKHFVEFTSPEFEDVLKAAGFEKRNEELVFEKQGLDVPAEVLMEKIEEFRYLSFAEIVEIVSAGKTPPGIRTITEVPLGTSEVVSNTARPKKPWLELGS